MRDWKITIPITGIIKFFKNRGKPSTEEKIKREMDKLKKSKCCWTYGAENDNGFCTVCGRSWRGKE